MKDYRRLAVALSVVIVAGCTSMSPAPVVERGGNGVTAGAAARDLYTIKGGDTLYSIAREHGIDYRDLIAWNSIESPNRIRPGQQLRVRPPGAIVAPGDTVVTQPIGGVTGGVEQRPLDGGAPAAASTSTLKTEPKDGKLLRSLTWDTAARADIGISHPDGVTVTEAPGSAAGHRTFIYSWK